jgi:hypothetical protein
MCARLVAKHLCDELGKLFIVEDKPSASGVGAVTPIAAPALGHHTTQLLTRLLNLRAGDLCRLREAAVVLQDSSYD